jgi:putative membrane protein
VVADRCSFIRHKPDRCGRIVAEERHPDIETVDTQMAGVPAERSISARCGTMVAVASPWVFQWHPEVLVLVAALTGGYIYLVRGIGPAAVRAGGQPITHRNLVCFAGAMVMLLVASSWPIHDLGEGYLYSVHMLQHMMLSYFLPPLALLATPEWLLRALIGPGSGRCPGEQSRTYRVVRWLCHPVVAAVIFNVAIIVSHIPGVVNASLTNGPLHYGIHLLVVTTALLMWMPVCGPIPEFRIGDGAKMIYLFLQSVVPTVPAAWLTFAEGAVYRPYGEQPVRVWGLSVTDDQQLAGAIMKTGGSIFLWTIIVIIWFKRFSANYRQEHDYHRRPVVADATVTATEETLTFEQVEREFAKSAPPLEP